MRVIDGIDEFTRQAARLDDPDDRAFILRCLSSNQDGDAELFIAQNYDRFAYDHSLQSWFYFDGNAWREDTTGLAEAAIMGIIGAYTREGEAQGAEARAAAESGDADRARLCERQERHLLTCVLKLQEKRRKLDVLELAGFDYSGWKPLHLAMKGDEWDLDPMLIACTNGVIDLTTGKLRPGQPKDYIRTVCPTQWRDLETPAPRWQCFVQEIFDGNTKIANYLQRLLGYAITGQSVEHVLPIAWGSKGRNGKGTLLEVINAVLGPGLSGPVESEMLLQQKYARHAGSPTSDLMDLRGKRIVWASEVPEGRRFSAGRVKWLTGDDTITGRAPYGRHQISFRPTHKLILLTNHKPHAPANDYAFWSRIHLIPFTLSFVDDPKEDHQRQRDPRLPQKLREEASGVLSWLVQGCLLWQQYGLEPPDEVKAATAEYRQDEDLIGKFITERCQIGEDLEVQSSVLYKSYKEWCAEVGIREMSLTAFGTEMKERFSSDEGRRTFYKGLDLCEKVME